MGRQALITVLCWLSFSQTFGDKRTYSLAIQDNESAESAPRLYRNVPVGVYASAAPYGAYSFHLPTFVSAPKVAASQQVPVKQNFVNHLTDSYGHKYVGSPQLTYKLAFPQQFVPLQTKLPEHLAQPLVAASANFQFKQANGQYFGSPYRVSSIQAPAPTPLNQFPTFGQLYADKVKNLAPTSVVISGKSQAFGFPNTQQQPSNNKAVFTNTQSQQQYNYFKNEPKFAQQREPQLVIGKPKGSSPQSISSHSIFHDLYSEPKLQKIQAAPHTSFSEQKLHKIQEAPHSSHEEQKFQRLQEAPHQVHNDKEESYSTHGPELKQHQQSSHSSHDEPKYETFEELPHYESKFQIIQEATHSPDIKKIQVDHTPHGEVKYQRVKESTPTSQTHLSYERPRDKPQHTRHAELKSSPSNKAKLQAAPGKQTFTYINDIDGKKTIVELDSTPKLPLLDITLLEPLKFDNPFVPQVQHFLPRIHQATYQTLPELTKKPVVNNHQNEYDVQKSTSYDSADTLDKPYKDSTKKKHKKPIQSSKHAKKNDSPKKTIITYHGAIDHAPEIVYEIKKSPTYKETIKEKAISYNKETQAEPVHYTYGSKTNKDPVTYSYSRTSKEPYIVQYETDPKALIYTFKPKELAHEEDAHETTPHHSGEHSENVNDNEHRQESEDDDIYHNEHKKQHPHTGEQYEKHHHSGEQYKRHPHSGEQYKQQPHSGEQKEHPHSGEQYKQHPQSGEHKEYPHSGEQYKHHTRSGEPNRQYPHSGEQNKQHPHSGEQYKQHSHSGEHKENPHFGEHFKQQPQSGEQHRQYPHSGEQNKQHPHSGEQFKQHSHSGENKEHPHSGEHFKQHPQSGEQHRQYPHSGEQNKLRPHFGEQYKQQSHSGENKEHPHSGEQYKQHSQSGEQHRQYTHSGGEENLEPSHKEQQNYDKPNEGKKQEAAYDSPPKYYSEPVQLISENINFQPILKEYENNIRLLTAPSASIKLDPHNQEHQSKFTSTPQPQVKNNEEKLRPVQQDRSHGHDNHSHSPISSGEPQKHYYNSSPHIKSYNGPAPVVHEKSKRIIVQEETPDERHMLSEQMRAEVINEEENDEEEFEKAYHNAALGFPAYKQKSLETEKDIFDPASYGVSSDQIEYDFDPAPFQQYQEDGDEFPKETRLNYKDAREKTMQNYYSDFSVRKPESLLDRYQNKLGYYKLFKEQKPGYLAAEEDEKEEKKSAKYVVAPAFSLYSPQTKGMSFYGQPQQKQQLYEYDYSNGAPRDNSAFASRPYQSYKSRTSFVEPQFQYGFEPVSIPKLLDSELAAMASFNRPQSEKPGTRKKVYKENWYIKKTSSSAGAPAS